MCLVVALQRVHPDYPVVIAANRDEFYARPATGPTVLRDEPRIVGGRDEVSGGTWMAITPTGLFVAITNQRTYHGADPARRSRGPLVVEAAAAGSTAAITAMLEAQTPGEYNDFNLIYGDAGGLFLAYARGDAAAVEIEPVPDGVQVLPNDRLNSPTFQKVARARALTPADASFEQLAAMLRDHELPDLDAVENPPADSPFTRELARQFEALCIHTDVYGTRSSAIVALAPGRVARYLFADGPPCTTEMTDATELVSP
jgi:uncharacterized protein with NRDE domain